MARFSAIWFLIPSIAFAQATAVIKGPTQVAPGDLVILDASQSHAEALVWSLANSDKTFLPVESGTKCVFASGTPGAYVFLLSTAMCGDGKASIAQAKHTLTVGTLPPNPNPTPPDPEPGPVPQPLSPLAKATVAALANVQRNPGEAAKLAAVMRSIGTQATAEGWTLDALKSAFVKASRESVFLDDETKQRWATFNTFFGNTMKPLGTAAEAIAALNDMAAGLDAVEKGTTVTIQRTQSVTADVPSSGGTLRAKVEAINRSLDGLSKEIGQ